MDFFLTNLKETLDAINNFIDKSILVINAKKIRANYQINSSDRSKINFIWRSLKFLEGKGVLKKIASNGVINYKIISQKIDVNKFLQKITLERASNK